MNVELTNKMEWAIGSGALPISLGSKKDGRFLLLDGGVRDYCLDLSEKTIPAEQIYSASWSSNSKNYILKIGKDIIVYNWQTKKDVKLPIGVVSQRFDQFLDIIYKQSYVSEDDVVPYFINAFRKIRNYIGEKESAKDTLALFFKTLISLDDNEDIKAIDCDKWNIEDIDIPLGFETIASEIHRGVSNIKPNLEYILRHSAGPLFEETNREATFLDRQLNFFGGISSKLKLERNLYSSIHYTPLYIARTLVENVISKLDLSKRKITVLDPACGSASLLLEFIKQIKEKGYDGKIVVKGYDSEATAVNTAKFLLQFEKRMQWSGDDFEYSVSLVADALTQDWGKENDIIIMNPPFMSWNLLDNQGKESVSAILSTLKMKRKPNEAVAFLYKAVSSLSQKGIIGSIVPSSFFIADQYDNIREDIGNKVSLNVIARLGSYVFENALTDVGLIICTSKDNDSTRGTTLNIWCKNQKGSAYEVLRNWRKMNYEHRSSVNKKDYSIYTPIVFPYLGKTWSVISKTEYDFYDKLQKTEFSGKYSRLSEVFVINQGILAGRQNIFEVSASFYDDLPTEEKNLYRPLIESGSIDTGYITIDRYIWYPYSTDGLMIRSEEELQNYKISYQRLISFKKDLSERVSVKNWWDLTRSRSVLYSPKLHLFSQRFGNSSSFGINEDKNLVIEEGNIMDLIDSNRKSDYYFYLALFSSEVFETLLSIYSKRIMKGYDLGKEQIKNIPVINLNHEKFRNTEEYKKMCNWGRELSYGNKYLKYSIDEVAKELYPYYEG